LPLKFGKRPSGYAFVGYSTGDVARKAVEELNEKSEWNKLCVTINLVLTK
jgi:RNA recognition motif-containing protein